MSKIDRREIALAIAKKLQDTIASLRISDRMGVTVIDSLEGEIKITDNGVFVKTRYGVTAGWTHRESNGPEHSAMRCNLLLRSVS